jgi:hypothetical protein
MWVWIRFIWLRIGTSWRLQWTRQWISVLHKILGISFVAERLATAPEGLISMETVSYLLNTRRNTTLQVYFSLNHFQQENQWDSMFSCYTWFQSSSHKTKWPTSINWYPTKPIYRKKMSEREQIVDRAISSYTAAAGQLSGNSASTDCGKGSYKTRKED